MLILKIFGFIVAVVFFIVIIVCSILVLHCLSWFHWRPCRHCGHHMEYKGLKEDDKEGHYLFHCPYCGAWEQIPKEEFFRDMIKEDYTNPYRDKL